MIIRSLCGRWQDDWAAIVTKVAPVSPAGNADVTPQKYAGGGLIPPAGNTATMAATRSVGTNARKADIVICDATAAPDLAVGLGAPPPTAAEPTKPPAKNLCHGRTERS